jgi:HEAT repeat protein
MVINSKIPFSAVLDALLDDNKPFPPAYLSRFSDIPGSELRALMQVWPQVSIIRKRALLEDLEDTAERDTIVSYHDLGESLLGDADAQVRHLAIRLLFEEDDTAFIPAYMKILDSDEDAQVRTAAASALGIYVYDGELEEISEELLHQVEDKLIEVVKGGDVADVRRHALESLGFSSRDEVPQLIKDAYKNGTQEWVVSALFAMGRSADHAWDQYVLDNLDHPSDPVRFEAVRAAGELDLKKARQHLMTAAYKDEDDDVRHAAIWSLSQLGGNQVTRLLERMLENADDDEEIQLLEDALENLSFTNDMEKFELLEIDEDILDDNGDAIEDDFEEED